MITSKPLKWHGGKSYLARQIVELMPPHKRYVETHFGGGAVLFAKPCDGVAEFANDLDRELSNFWRVLQDPATAREFIRIASVTPLSEDVFNAAGDFAGCGTNVGRAVMFFVLNRQSRQALGKSYCAPTSRTRRGMNEQVSAWLSAVEGLPEAHARLMRVEIRNQDANTLIHELDSLDTLFYCDPPYLHETRIAKKCYQHEMSCAQHELLLATLSEVKGKFILSGYPSDLYAKYEQEHGWRRVDVEIDNKASSAKSKEKKIECLWMNYEPEIKESA